MSNPRPSRPKQRRALTQARTSARVEPWGDPTAAKALMRALDVAEAGEEQARLFTHGFHAYPARMHPLTARRALEAFGLLPGALVIDPFCGSGTVLVEAVRAGLRAVGVDANPLAVMVARAKVWVRTPARRRELTAAVRRIGALVVADGKAARRAGWEAPPARKLPPGVDGLDRNEKLKGWFDPHVRRELESLVLRIAGEPDEELREIMMAILSSILIKMSRRESDTVGEKVTRKLGRGMAARLFVGRAEELVVGLDALASKAPPGTPAAEVKLGDARALDRVGIAAGSAAAIVCSPPYAGTYDYLDHHQLRLTFLGLPVAEFASAEMGARRAFVGPAGRVTAALERWERELGSALAEMTRALAPGGEAVVLIGDSLAGRGPGAQAVRADDVVARMAPAVGLTVIAAASQGRDMLGAQEQRAFGPRPKREHLVLLRKERRG